jgi:hypothetical protein
MILEVASKRFLQLHQGKPLLFEHQFLYGGETVRRIGKPDALGDSDGW